MDDLDRVEIKQQIDALLKKHMGPEDCILMNEIFVEVTGGHIIPNRRIDQTRFIRTIIKELREDGRPIGIKAGSKNGGYFTARNDEELKTTIETFHCRAMSSLKQEAALKRITFNELLEQYELELSQEQTQEKIAS